MLYNPGEKNWTVSTRPRVASSLDLQTQERKLWTFIPMRDDHVLGDRVSPGTSWQEGSWERWYRRRQRWINGASLPKSTHLRLYFPPQKVWGMKGWEAFLSTAEMQLDVLRSEGECKGAGIWGGSSELLSWLVLAMRLQQIASPLVDSMSSCVKQKHLPVKVAVAIGCFDYRHVLDTCHVPRCSVKGSGYEKELLQGIYLWLRKTD